MNQHVFKKNIIILKIKLYCQFLFKCFIVCLTSIRTNIILADVGRINYVCTNVAKPNSLRANVLKQMLFEQTLLEQISIEQMM